MTKLNTIKRYSTYLGKAFYFRQSDLERAALKGHTIVRCCKPSGEYYHEDYKDAPLRLVALSNLD